MADAARRVYLLIGYQDDLCCREVAAVLRARGARVVSTPEPLAGEIVFSWAQGAGEAMSTLRFADGETIKGDALGGVLVRAQGGPYGVENWKIEDLVYARTEMAAALVAWLWDLPCPVINRLPPDLWFQPQRPLVEWRPLLRRHEIPTARVLICRDEAAAHGFAERWRGTAMYAPLTSRARYPVASEAEWDELRNVMSQLPVCLLEPYEGRALHACVAGDVVVWDRPAALSGEERRALETGLYALSAEQGLGTIEAEMRRGAAGLQCFGIGLFPRLERYGVAERGAIAEALAGLLGVAG